MESGEIAAVHGPRWLREGVPVFLVALIAVLSGLVGLFIGEHHAAAKTLTGRAIVGQEVAVVQVSGVSYQVAPVPFWIDGSGGLHDGGWPSCLKVGTRPMIRVAEVTVTAPGGGGGVTPEWVDCRG